MDTEENIVRMDKWLWAARLFKTRSLAVDAIKGGKVKVDGNAVKPAREVKVGDVIHVQIEQLHKVVEVKTVIKNRVSAKQVPEVIAYWPFKSGKMLVDATGNGNVLTGSGVTLSDDGAAVFDGSQSGFATLAPLPLYLYKSMTVEWFMQTSMSGLGMVLETTSAFNSNPGRCSAASTGFPQRCCI